MKILYGVVGSGMGHAIRSSVALKKLVDDGHDVHVVASGGAVNYIRERFSDVVTEIWGLDMVVEDQEVKKRLTGIENLKGAIKGLPRNVAEFVEVEAEFSPDVVISDFETWSWMFGKLFNRPIVCVDNIQIMNRCRHDRAIIAGEDDDFELARQIVKARTPGAAHYLITTFFYPEVRKDRTTLVPPLLRDSILNARAEEGEHLLVYQTSSSYQTLPDVLKTLDVPVYVYGLRPDIEADQVDENITYRPFSNTQFVEDLATCRGVVASAGFTLMSEAVHLGKPYLATPVRGQFEQVMNARYLHELGYGTYDLYLDRDTLENFIARLDDYREGLQRYERHDNSVTLGEIDAFLDRVASDLV